MELTKQYFDEQFAKLGEKFVTKEYFDEQVNAQNEKVEILDKKMGSLVTKNGFDKKLATLATKYDLDVQTRELKQYVHEAFETQQVYIDERTLELNESMDINNRLKQHDYWFDKLANKVGISLQKN
jgi:hypothetical protein